MEGSVSHILYLVLSFYFMTKNVSFYVIFFNKIFNIS